MNTKCGQELGGIIINCSNHDDTVDIAIAIAGVTVPVKTTKEDRIRYSLPKDQDIETFPLIRVNKAYIHILISICHK